MGELVLEEPEDTPPQCGREEIPSQPSERSHQQLVSLLHSSSPASEARNETGRRSSEETLSSEKKLLLPGSGAEATANINISKSFNADEDNIDIHDGENINVDKNSIPSELQLLPSSAQRRSVNSSSLELVVECFDSDGGHGDLDEFAAGGVEVNYNQQEVTTSSGVINSSTSSSNNQDGGKKIPHSAPPADVHRSSAGEGAALHGVQRTDGFKIPGNGTTTSVASSIELPSTHSRLDAAAPTDYPPPSNNSRAPARLFGQILSQANRDISNFSNGVDDSTENMFVPSPIFRRRRSGSTSVASASMIPAISIENGMSASGEAIRSTSSNVISDNNMNLLLGSNNCSSIRRDSLQQSTMAKKMNISTKKKSRSDINISIEKKSFSSTTAANRNRLESFSALFAPSMQSSSRRYKSSGPAFFEEVRARTSELVIPPLEEVIGGSSSRSSTTTSKPKTAVQDEAPLEQDAAAVGFNDAAAFGFNSAASSSITTFSASVSPPASFSALEKVKTFGNYSSCGTTTTSLGTTTAEPLWTTTTTTSSSSSSSSSVEWTKSQKSPGVISKKKRRSLRRKKGGRGRTGGKKAGRNNC